MKQLLIAVDGSQYTAAAAEFLAKLPMHGHLSATVLTVVDPSYVEQDEDQAEWLMRREEAEQKAASEAFEVVRRHLADTNIKLRAAVRKGSLGPTIVQAASQELADLVVLGARGRSSISRMILGSTSDYVATHCQSSVLVVRPVQRPIGNQIKRVTVCYDDTRPARIALRELARFDWNENTEIDLLYVSEFVDGFSKRSTDTDQHTRRMTNTLRDSADKIMHRGPVARARLVESEHVGEGIIEYLEENEADLVMLGETPRNPLSRLVLGSVSRYVLRHAPCSVLLSRSDSQP